MIHLSGWESSLGRSTELTCLALVPLNLNIPLSRSDRINVNNDFEFHRYHTFIGIIQRSPSAFLSQAIAILKFNQQ
ncbi:MAG: hypothetical protein ACKO2V_19100, partial [Snowella sp.]